MKSVHRHNLQTNLVAHWLEVYIERYRPYVSKIVAGILAFIALLFIWSYVSGSSAASRNKAWDSYNQAVGAQPMNMEELHRTAADYPGTAMQQMADVTWADGQLWMASNAYIYNRPVANEALNRAASAYQGVIQSSKDERLTARARLGLARVFEMQNELEKARAQYEQVTGPYAKYAKAQAERLATPEAKETYAWLATAQPPRQVAPPGPGTPGTGPEFSPGDISLPTGNETNLGGADQSKDTTDAIDSLFKEMQKEPKANEKEGDRYKTDQPPATDAPPAAPSGAAAPGDSKSSEAPATGDATKTNPAPAAPADEKKPAK